VWALDVSADGHTAECPYCQSVLTLAPGDRSATLPAHDAADDRLPIPAADLPDLIAEVQADVETRSGPDGDILNHVLARLIRLYQSTTARACVDPDHGIGDHPCDEVLGAERAAALRDPGDDAFEAAREFDRTHPGYWEWTEEETR
jgi:hypothetical protein